jgi:DNA-binding Lrp family transcriptional regulator
MQRRSFLAERIISLLMENPTVTKKEIKERLGVSDQSIQKQMLRLKNSGAVLPSYWVSERYLQSRRTFWVFILTKPDPAHRTEAEENDYQERLCLKITRSFEDKALIERLGGGLIFGSVDIVLGGAYDIILRIHTDNPDAAAHYVTRFLRGQPEIVSTSTAWSLVRRSAQPSDTQLTSDEDT